MARWFLAAALVLAACTGSHQRSATTTRPLDPFATAGPPTTPASSGSTPALALPALDVGQCFDTDQFTPGSAIDLASARVVDCNGPHQHEVFAVEVDLSRPGTRYPGDAALAAFADDRCLAAFTPYTGLDYRASHFDIANARPDETTWNSGERHVICALHDADFGELVGSARAAPSS